MGIPIPGYNIHPDLLFCPYIWQITSTEISYRQHYAILPGVQTVTIERATGWHICRFGPDKSDGWYYLEHYLAMEERRELEVQTRGSTEPGIPPIYVVTVRPAFDWTEYYRLSPPGYRQYGLFYTMGTGIGPVLALDGFHKQPPLPGIKFNYQPDSPERRLGNGFVVPDNQPRPNYRNLAWNSQHLLHIWQHWERYQCILVSMARDQPGMSGILTYQTSESKSISWFRYHQDLSIALGYAGYNIRRLEGQAAGPMAQGDVPVQFGSYLMDPRRPPAPPPIVGLNMHQGPYSQNNQAVNPNASLRIELNYNQGGEGGLPTMLVSTHHLVAFDSRLADFHPRSFQKLLQPKKQSAMIESWNPRRHPDQHQIQMVRLADLVAVQGKSISLVICPSRNVLLTRLNMYRTTIVEDTGSSE